MFKKIFNSIFFWGSLGPSQLLLTLIVFILQSSLGILTPYSWVGFTSSWLLGVFVTVLAMKEVASLHLTQKEQTQTAREELAHLQLALRSAQMAKLEEKETMQNTLQRMRQNHDEEMKNMHIAQGKLCADNFESKNKALTLQASLEAALEELGKSRQLDYLKQELDQKLSELSKQPAEKVDESHFFDHVHAMQEETLALEQEIFILQEIITQLLSEKKVSRSRKLKKEDQPTLLEELLK